MIDDKNLMYLPNETQILNQPIQESNKVENNLNSTQNEAGLDNEIKNEENYLGNNGRWRRNEHIRFLGGCLQYGNNWKKVETYVRTRTSTQIRSHAQKYLKKLEKNIIQMAVPKIKILHLMIVLLKKSITTTLYLKILKAKIFLKIKNNKKIQIIMKIIKNKIIIRKMSNLNLLI